MKYAVWSEPSFERPVWARIIKQGPKTVRVQISKNWQRTLKRKELIATINGFELDLLLRQEGQAHGIH